jgi:hypothetical protein
MAQGYDRGGPDRSMGEEFARYQRGHFCLKWPNRGKTIVRRAVVLAVEV